MCRNFMLKTDWLFYHSILLIVGLLMDVFYCTILFLPIGAFFSFSFFYYNNWSGFTELKKYGGLPNLITSLRLLSLFCIPFVKDHWALAFITTSVVLLDGLDGYLARKLNLVTLFGEQLDMETDAFFCLILSLVIFTTHRDLAWILVGGSLRYAYKISTTLITKNNFVATKKKYARFLAGCYFLSIVLFFFVSYPVGKFVILIGNAVVIFSFSLSFYEFFKFDKKND